MARHWSGEVINGIETGRALEREAYMEVPYEKLVLNVETTLWTICSFLEELLYSNMLIWHDLTVKKTADRPMKLQTKLSRAPCQSDAGLWKNEIYSNEVAILDGLRW